MVTSISRVALVDPGMSATSSTCTCPAYQTTGFHNHNTLGLHPGNANLPARRARNLNTFHASPVHL